MTILNYRTYPGTCLLMASAGGSDVINAWQATCVQLPKLQ